ncbi:alpha/beta hydrolase fold domain-containing protein [Streptomyces lydicus]|uniref:alpha/beta hydrolase fold domain-containing protein n=1 Tax=Streptomyces lydicus TaxID=47763 RepID=UPI003F4D9BA7
MRALIVRSTSSLPPAYIATAEFNPNRDEGIEYPLRLLQAGVSVELHQWPADLAAATGARSYLCGTDGMKYRHPPLFTTRSITVAPFTPPSVEIWAAAAGTAPSPPSWRYARLPWPTRRRPSPPPTISIPPHRRRAPPPRGSTTNALSHVRLRI